jgi:UDP-MurNAc hydroxylase
MLMEIRMVGHASVIVTTPLGAIWCDPWLRGKAFNNSWTMRPDPVFEPRWYSEIRYIWISHEHPDHFSVPTLRGFDEAFKQRVTVLFQKRNSDKLFKAMRAWGFQNFVDLPNRREIRLETGVALHCYQVGLLDSVVTIKCGDETIININDADLSQSDLRYLKSIAGAPQVILNQFSIAGYDGYFDRDAALKRVAQQKIESMLAVHQSLEAKHTLPFASFVYFSAIDNKFMNGFANSIRTVQDAFDAHDCATVVLYPGDCYTVGKPWDNRPALTKLQRLHESVDQAPYDVPALIPVTELQRAFAEFCRVLAERYPRFLIRRIGTIRFHLQDLGVIASCDFLAGELHITENDTARADIEVYSQPLHHGFGTPFGFETLGVSGRFRVINNRRRWRMLKVLSILNNQEVYLRLPYALEKQTLTYLSQRLRSNLLRQLARKRELRNRVDPATEAPLNLAGRSRN